MALLGGVDGCKDGWLLLALDRETRAITPEVFPSAWRLFECVPRLHAMTIDIPIGLTDGPSRLCDVEARRLLGPSRGSSVFSAPVRAALEASTYSEACDFSHTACGKRLSKQAFGILPRIRDVDEQMRRLSNSQNQVREVHPEVCFYFWADGRPMQFGKKDREGLNERLRLAESAFPGTFGKVRAKFTRRAVADDDIVDALAALWTAERLVGGAATIIPDEPPLDRYGLRMEMVA